MVNSTTTLPSPIIPKKSSKINDVLHSLTNTLDAIPTQKKIQELSAGNAKDYLTAILQCYHIINKQLCHYKQLVQQHQELITEFQERKHLVYNEINNQGSMQAGRCFLSV